MDSRVNKIIYSLKKSPDIKYSSKEALLLIDNGKVKVVERYINNFTDLNAKVAKKLIDMRKAWVVAYYKDIFTGFKLDSVAALEMIKSGLTDIGFYINNFTDLNTEVADILIKEGYARVVMENIDKFVGFELDSAAALKMIKHEQAKVVEDYISNFIDLNTEVADILIDNRYALVVVKNADKFVGFELNSNAALKMIKSGLTNIVGFYINNFTDLNTEVAEKLITEGYAWVVVENIDKFSNLNAKVAKKLIDMRKAWVVVEYINKFVDLNAEVVVKLMKEGYSKEVISLLKMGHPSFDIEGIMKDRSVSFNSFYLYEIVKYPSVISDICN